MIRIEIEADTAEAAHQEMAFLLRGSRVADAVPQRDLPDGPVITDAKPAEQPKTEPEIVPPKRTRAKKADTTVQPDVTDINGNGDPVEVDPTAAEIDAMSADEKSDLLKTLMIDVVKKHGEPKVYDLLKDAKVKNRTEALGLPADKLAAFVDALRKAVA